MSQKWPIKTLYAYNIRQSQGSLKLLCFKKLFSLINIISTNYIVHYITLT